MITKHQRNYSRKKYKSWHRNLYRKLVAKLLTKYISKMTNEEENRFLDSLPEYIDYATLSTKALQVDLQFEIPPCGNAAGETIGVSLSPTSHYGATVTEYDGNKKRVFELDSSGEYPNCSAYVTEHV